MADPRDDTSGFTNFDDSSKSIVPQFVRDVVDTPLLPKGVRNAIGRPILPGIGRAHFVPVDADPARADDALAHGDPDRATR
jgi:hypothetical protein